MRVRVAVLLAFSQTLNHTHKQTLPRSPSLPLGTFAAWELPGRGERAVVLVVDKLLDDIGAEIGHKGDVAGKGVQDDGVVVRLELAIAEVVGAGTGNNLLVRVAQERDIAQLAALLHGQHSKG